MERDIELFEVHMIFDFRFQLIFALLILFFPGRRFNRGRRKRFDLEVLALCHGFSNTLELIWYDHYSGGQKARLSLARAVYSHVGGLPIPEGAGPHFLYYPYRPRSSSSTTCSPLSTSTPRDGWPTSAFQDLSYVEEP